ncbi:MAG: DNA ligase [Vibrio sp.]
MPLSKRICSVTLLHSALGFSTMVAASNNAAGDHYAEVTKTQYNAVALANEFHDDVNLQDYWYSEKYDGIRAVWTGKELRTRNGNRIFAPKWFIESLPDEALDGELWSGREQFHYVQRTVLDDVPNDSQWKKVIYMVFDMPNEKGVFAQRYQKLADLVHNSNTEYLRLAEHFPLESESDLDQLLDNIERLNGEGIMLRNKRSLYHVGRSDDLLKLKSFQDDEAIVIGYKEGKGKYNGMTGSLLVKWRDGKVFYIGSGLSNKERVSPPPIGSLVNFRYNGLTSKGLPRFVRFSHIHKDCADRNLFEH